MLCGNSLNSTTKNLSFDTTRDPYSDALVEASDSFVGIRRLHIQLLNGRKVEAFSCLLLAVSLDWCFSAGSLGKFFD
jgi:hypothetical protein